MKKSVKLLCMLFVFILSFSVIQTSFIASATNSSELYYDIYKNKEALVSCQLATLSGDVVIADTYEGKKVTGFTEPTLDEYMDIMAYIFSDGVTSITLPNTIKSKTLSGYAFIGCPSAKIIISDDNTELCLENNVLYNKAKTKLIRYQNSSSKKFTIPDTVTEVAPYAFSNTNLKTLTIPSSVKSFGYMREYEIGDLTDIYFNGTNEQWDKMDKPYHFDNLTIHFEENNNSSSSGISEFFQKVTDMFNNEILPFFKSLINILVDFIFTLIG